MAWSEDRLHRWLARRLGGGGVIGRPGHDAVVFGRDPGRPVMCCDQVIVGVHVDPDERPALIGAKAALRTLSDLAATASRPRGLLAAVRAPSAIDEVWLQRLLAGLDRAGSQYGARLMGGDLACAEGPPSVSVTALGTADASRPPVHRDRGRPGQTLLATGRFGGSRLGRHLRPRPRIQAGLWLQKQGATAMMDVSDGLAWDLFRLARSSEVRIVLEDVPVHPDARRASLMSERTALDHALHDGEDHELLALLPASKAEAALLAGERARSSLELASPDRIRRLGRVERGRGLRLEVDGQTRTWDPEEGGWRHG